MKKKWIVWTIMALLIISIFLSIIIAPDFIKLYKISKRLDYLKSEIYVKKNKINEVEIEKVLYNSVILDGKDKELFLESLKEMTFSKSEDFLKTKDIKYNKSIEILTNKSEKINFDFYFDQECRELFVKTEDGMLAIKSKELCRYLKSYDNKI